MGILPGNPLDESKKQQIKEITERVTKNFSKYYLISFKEVLIEEVKRKRIENGIERVKKERKAEKEKDGPKPRRERKKKEKKKKIR
jgi:hypothetical protein